MRILKTVLIDGEAVELQSENLLLELSNVGRGFITVRTDKDCVGKIVHFELGEYDHYFLWFNGFVEEQQSAERGYKRLFIRENVAKLEQPLPLSLRHCTLRELCDLIQSKTGLDFIVPERDYTHAPIPLCTHAGSGLQLLNALGRMFQIPEYIWQQNADGSVFVGSWADSKHAGDEVTVGELESLLQRSNGLTIPINAGIRAGCLLNGKRVKRVRLEGHNYEIEWESEQKSPERLKMEQEYPELAGGYHLSKYARIVAVSDPSNEGDIADHFRPKYAVDIQLLDENGNDEQDTPIFAAVPLPVPSMASQGGEFAFPEVGTIVEVGFMYGRSDMPIIRNFFPFGKTMPSVGIGEMLKQQRPEVFERLDAAGNRFIETDQAIIEKSYSREITADNENRSLGTSITSIDSDKIQSIGGNYQLQALGNIESITAADHIVGVGGNLQQRIAGVASLISQTKAEISAPETNIQSPVVEISAASINIGNENANILKILEDTITILADLAEHTSTHTHPSVGQSQQASMFTGLSDKARQQKGLLTPMIA